MGGSHRPSSAGGEDPAADPRDEGPKRSVGSQGNGRCRRSWFIRDVKNRDQ